MEVFNGIHTLQSVLGFYFNNRINSNIWLQQLLYHHEILHHNYRWTPNSQTLTTGGCPSACSILPGMSAGIIHLLYQFTRTALNAPLHLYTESLTLVCCALFVESPPAKETH